MRPRHGNRHPCSSGHSRHGRRPGQAAAVTRPGYFIEPVLKLFVVGVGIDAKLIGVFSFGFRKPDQVLDTAVFGVAALRPRDSVARPSEGDG